MDEPRPIPPPVPAPYLAGVDVDPQRIDEAKRLLREAREEFEREIGQVIAAEPPTDPESRLTTCEIRKRQKERRC